ncbi:MAG: TraB/GumN family protein, partial [Bacteroidota bacterium]
MKQLSVCVLLLFSISFLFAQETSQKDSTLLEINEDRNSLLWKITGNDLEAPSYLFGTIHMIGKKDYIFNEKMQLAFDTCKNVVFEIKIDDMMNLGAQMGMMSKVFMSGGKTLKDLLSDEDYNAVKDHFQEIGLPLMFLERMKPMFLSAMASG